jgi:hypothetical protein
MTGLMGASRSRTKKWMNFGNWFRSALLSKSSPEPDNCRNQAITQACAVCSPFLGDFECNGDVTPTGRPSAVVQRFFF